MKGFALSRGIRDTQHFFNDKPRITFLCARYRPDQHGGVERRMDCVTRAIAQKGWRVQVLTENRGSAVPSETLGPNLVVRRLPPFDPGRWWRWKEFSRIGWWHEAIRQWSLRGPVWATDPLMATAAILAGRGDDLIFNPAACVAAMRHVGQVHPEATTLQRPRQLAWIDRWACRRAGKIVVGSRNLSDQLERFYGPLRYQPHVVGHGVEMPSERVARAAALGRWGIGVDRFVVGFVGRLDPCKGLDFLFKAAASGGLGDRGHLLIVGDGPDQGRLSELAQRLGITGRVTWGGRVESPAVAYAAMDLFVLPSIYEAFGNVVLEAMAHGVPVIARAGDGRSSFTAAGELVEHGGSGFVIDSGDVRGLIENWRWIEQNVLERQKMSMRAVAFAASHSWGKTAGEYLRLVTDGRGVQTDDASGLKVA